MSECQDLQALGKISSEVDDSHVKIILSSQCIKAQTFLIDRLRKESGRAREFCKYINNGNLKLEAEIKHAEQELRSLMTAHETVKMSNVDLNKEYLMAKEKKLDTIDRVNNGETKYEKLWLTCKKRYESIPFVQKWFEYTNKTESLKERIKFLLQETDALKEEIKTKRATLQDQDKMRIIAMATFLVHERPKQIKEIKKQMQRLSQLAAEIDEYDRNQAARRDSAKPRDVVKASAIIKLVDGEWPSLCDNFNNIVSLEMPVLQLAHNDLDISEVNLEQIKKYVASPIKSKSQEARDFLTWENQNQREDSSFFNKSYLPQEMDSQVTMEEETNVIARKKLINILEDIAVDKKEAKSMLSTVDPHAMQEVTEIGANMNGGCPDETGLSEMEQTKDMETECEYIEEIDMSTGTSNIVVPPTQFMDLSKEHGDNNAMFQQEVEVVVHASCVPGSPLSQPKADPESCILNIGTSLDGSQKKRVAFDLPPIQEVPEEVAGGETGGKNPDEEVGSHQDNSGGNDDSFTKMKEMILRKHHLDLSPDFVYAKKPALISDDKVITSKFFKYNETQNKTDDDVEQMQRTEEDTQEIQKKNVEMSANTGPVKENVAVDKLTLSYKNEEKVDKTVSGLLFTHGPHGIPDSLDVSISTTGFEDGDGEFPHCIDSSLLLSPKADIPMPVSGASNEVYSQEVPNFLSGMRKTGLSFFGKSSGVGQPDSSAAKDANNFNFNFNKGDDKKSRSGLFSMFH